MKITIHSATLTLSLLVTSMLSPVQCGEGLPASIILTRVWFLLGVDPEVDLEGVRGNKRLATPSSQTLEAVLPCG